MAAFDGNVIKRAHVLGLFLAAGADKSAIKRVDRAGQEIAAGTVLHSDGADLRLARRHLRGNGL